MIRDEVTVADLRELARRPGTVLVAELVDEIHYTPRVVMPIEMTANQCPIYSTSLGEQDPDGLRDEVRTYLTHTEIRTRLDGKPEHEWDYAAHQATVRAHGCFESWRRGDDAVADELLNDPTAWAKYSI